MIEKNIVGTYRRDEAFPAFSYDQPDGPAIAPVGGVGGPAAISGVSGVGTGADPVEQWRAFSEQLRARRLAKERIGQQYEQEQQRRQQLNAAAAYSAYGQTSLEEQTTDDQNFQRAYEQDMVEFHHQPNPMMLGLQRHLQTVNHVVPEEHYQAYEVHEDEHAESTGHELTVGEVMTRRVVCVLESTTIEQVASICNRRGFSGVPVVNQNQSLIGIVTLSDIMHQLLDQKSLSTYAEQGGEVLEQRALAILDEPVRNYMHRHVVTVLPETTVREACQVMMQHRIRRLVVARGDIVRGIFSAQDAVKVLATAALTVDDVPGA